MKTKHVIMKLNEALELVTADMSKAEIPFVHFLGLHGNNISCLPCQSPPEEICYQQWMNINSELSLAIVIKETCFLN